jgi:hypothetical protein
MLSPYALVKYVPRMYLLHQKNEATLLPERFHACFHVCMQHKEVRTNSGVLHSRLPHMVAVRLYGRCFHTRQGRGMLRKQQRFRSTRVGVCLALILSAFSLAAPAQVAPVQAKGNPHCTAQAQSTDTPIEEAAPKGFECFPTFAQAIAAATAGRVQLPPSAQPADLTDEILAAPPRLQRKTGGISLLGVSPSPNKTVIGIDYDGVDYSSTSLTWYVDNYDGCRNNRSYYVNSMPSGWDNVVSSAVGYAGCRRFTHWNYLNRGGASKNCGLGCYEMDVMNNATSSEDWGP